MRKTKVICTIGPACENINILSEMCKAGMNVARLNFSHGTHQEHQSKVNSMEEMFLNDLIIAKEVFNLDKGDNVVLTGVLVNGNTGNTNMVKVEKIM